LADAVGQIGEARQDPAAGSTPGIEDSSATGQRVGETAERHLVAIAKAAGRGIDPGDIPFEPEVFREAITERARQRQFGIAAYGGDRGCEGEAKPLLLRVSQRRRQNHHCEKRQRGRGLCDNCHTFS
jgi:hypothetical protein